MEKTLLLQRPPLLSVALISAAALAYEILLMRLLSIIHWHHFAYMIISVALLGYGASGTFLSLSRNWLKGRFNGAFVVNAVMFGLTSVACFAVAQSLPFNALEVLWDPLQPLWLLCIYLLLFIPFFCAANCICLCFSEFPRHTHRVYCFDLLGAGLGGLLAIALLFLLLPATALSVMALLGLLTAFVAMAELKSGTLAQKLGLALITAAVAVSSHGLPLNLSQFKGLKQALSVQGAGVVDERSSPLGLLTTVESPSVPFRHAPGLSLNTPGEPPAQLAVFTDGDGMSVITDNTGPSHALDYLDHVTSALPYHLLDPSPSGREPAVLVLGAGGGSDVLQALHLGATRVDAVEVNAQLIGLAQQEFGEYSGYLYDDPGVTVHIAEARGFVAAQSQQWDLIQIALLDSFGASAAGLHALSENYLYTVEAFREYLRKLSPGGILATTRWTKLPPRDGLKMFATAALALEESGIDNPGNHLVMIRAWNTSTLLASNEAFSIEDIERIRTFCHERWFDLVHYPGINEYETNQYNIQGEAWFYQASQSLLDERRAGFFRDYKFDIRPATDDRPYFFHFLKWRSMPEILSLRGQGGLPLLEQGYLILIATLLQAVLASMLLILLPLLTDKPSGQAESGGLWRIFSYFLAIGFAFMLIEISFIQKFILFLSHPLYTVAVVLSSFLLFAGLGSAVSGKWKFEARIVQIVSGIAVLAILYIFLLPPLFRQLISLPDISKIVISAMLIAPLAFLMGMPFPLGLGRVARMFPERVPWAWGINGCASVMGAVLATLLAIHTGFQLVVITAVMLYFLAAVSTPKSL
jgi:spermidine synthase